jgi:DNA-binding NarL/FixJ family response regulator
MDPGPESAATGRSRGSETARESLVATVRQRHPETKVLMIGPSDDAETVARALRDGALGWVTVDASAAHLVEAAHGVLHGEYRIAPTLLAAALGAGTNTGAAPGYASVAGSNVRYNVRSAVGSAAVSAVRSGAGARDGALARLSERERLVLSCLVGGLNRRDIAVRLGIAETTARTHIGRILIKLEAHSMVEAAAVGRRAGLSAVEP